MLNNGNLVGTTDSIQGNVTLKNGYAQLIFRQDTNGAYARNISGGGGELKQGTGLAAVAGPALLGRRRRRV